MEIPHRGSRPAGLPEIYVQDSNPPNRYRTISRSSSYNSASSPISSSIPMSIPNASEPVPPALPPPRHIFDIGSGRNNGADLGWKWGNSHEEGHGWGGSLSTVPTSSSLYSSGSFTSRRSHVEEQAESPRRQDLTSTNKSPGGLDSRDSSYARKFDEGYASLSGTSIGSNQSKYQEFGKAGFQSSVHDRYRSDTAQAFAKEMWQKLDARRGGDNKTPPLRFSSSGSDNSPTTRIALDHKHTQLKPLSLPIITSRAALVDSPVRWSDTPLSSAVSPRQPYSRLSGATNYESRSPSGSVDHDKSPVPYTRRSGSGSGMSVTDDASSVTSRSRESYDPRVSPDNDVDFQMEETGLRRLYLDDYGSRPDGYSPCATAGQKRRASSPPGDEGPSLHTVGSASDLYRRREAAARASPAPHYHSATGSVSSNGSVPLNNPYTSTMALSISELGTCRGVSIVGTSPSGSDPSDSSYITSMPLNSSPRGSVSRQNHHRAISESRPLITSRKMSDSLPKHPSIPRIQGVLMCECCPKKPKKFDSQEDLNAHEQEKQYECAYCRNRFKNKNEAERHQNSLHLRRHSWSCAALSGYAAVFHPSPNRPDDADTCGFCGEDFPRSGLSSPSPNDPRVPVATEQDWDIRISHLQEMHKFGECNHAKKFFRADHFRQHLKHSHAGTSGKWTNMLENACMKDEPLPEPIRGPERINAGGQRVGRINEEEEAL